MPAAGAGSTPAAGSDAAGALPSRRLPGRPADRQPRNRDVRDRSDSERVDDRPDADRPAQDPADREDRELDRGPHDADRVAAGRKSGHQPVARPRPQAGADVGPGGDPVQEHRPDHHRDLSPEPVDRVDRRQHHVDHHADHDHVADRPEPGPLAQRDPQHQDADADDDRPGADPEADSPGEALMEHVPRVDAEPGEQQHRARDAVQDQADEQLAQATRAGRREHRTKSASNGLPIHRPICYQWSVTITSTP